MRSIERSFKQYQKENPCWSTWTSFTKAIMGINFSKDKIRRYFNVLVDKDDYEKKEKMQLLKYLYQLSKSV